MSFKIKIRPADKLYSEWLRRERKMCERCGSKKSLQCSHYYGRANESVRFDQENTDCLCFGCHQYFTANPGLYFSWKFKKLGKQKYDMLTVRSATPQKKDDNLIIQWLKKELGMKIKTEKKEKCCGGKFIRKFCAMHMDRKSKKGKKEEMKTTDD